MNTTLDEVSLTVNNTGTSHDNDLHRYDGVIGWQISRVCESWRVEHVLKRFETWLINLRILKYTL
jgi:hypothetical protein